MEPNSSKKIMFYATRWCGDCHHSRHILKDAGVEFTEINIDDDELAAQKVIEISNGNKSVPTIVFPNGIVLVEPSTMELKNQINKYLN